MAWWRGPPKERMFEPKGERAACHHRHGLVDAEFLCTAEGYEKKIGTIATNFL